MEYLVNSNEMKRYDADAINEIGIPALVLMERAALSVIDVLLADNFNLKKVAVICGYGNNGGDGVAIARLLKARKIDVTLHFIGQQNHATDSTKQQIKIAQKYGVPMTPLPDNLSTYTTLIDALFGVGLSRDVSDEYAVTIEKINQSQADIMSVDIPSGICASSGNVLGTAVKARHTVTFAYKKLGCVLYPGCEYCSDVTVKDIGINDICFEGQPPAAYTYSKQDLPDLLPVRANYSNKGTFGKILIIAGSATMSGAAYFSAKAAYKTGAGLVKIFTPEPNRTILLSQLPEAILTTYDPANIDTRSLHEALSWAHVVVIGPGMSTETSTKQILSQVLEHCQVPVIIDADGLNVLAQNIALITNHKHPIIITPHLGEMSRLTSKTIKHISHCLISEAVEFAKQYQVICVLKDARTIVANGQDSFYVNQSGNNGMATGGSGDVLTGIIAGLIAQHSSPELAATLGVYLHGLAGDYAEQNSNAYSMTAEDIIYGLTNVMNV